MSVNDDLGKRMKEYYEEVTKNKLVRRMPVAIRIDGKAFHSFTKGLKRPFDDILIETMQDTTAYLCKNIQGCVLGYTQSDEITLILVDYKNVDSSAWFDNKIQKICSISASMATMYFNKSFENKVEIFKKEYYDSWSHTDEEEKYMKALEKAVCRGAMFDSRCFNIPKEEVTNLIYWRQLDARRNSIQMVGQSNFSSNQLHGKCCLKIQSMLIKYKNIDWNDYPVYKRRGSCCIKKEESFLTDNGFVTRSYWEIDKNIPIFENSGRDYIERLINFDNKDKDVDKILNDI